MKLFIVAIIVSYIFGGIFTCYKYIKEMPQDLADFKKSENNGPNVFAHQIGQWINIPILFFIWPLWWINS